MSTRVTQQKPVAGRPSRGLGLAAAGLAVVVTIGIGFTLSDGIAAWPSDVRDPNPQMSDSRRVKAENIAERDAFSPGANVEAYKVREGVVGVMSPEAFNIEEHRIRMAKADAQRKAVARQGQAYIDFQQERAQKSG